ncbi:hypothetical protein Hanom_Chr16g01435231 [Helianthus anomalus]
MFVHLTNRTKFLVHVRSFIKRTNINELPAERFTNCSLNVRFVYSPTHFYGMKNTITTEHGALGANLGKNYTNLFRKMFCNR